MMSLPPFRLGRVVWVLAAVYVLQGAPATHGEEPRTAALAEKRIRTALCQPVEIQFKATPLKDAVNFLKEAGGIQIQLNTKALDEVGIDSDTPITFAVSDISLRAALRHVLRSIDPTLTFAVRHEVLLITTREDEEFNLSTKIYDVSDLADQPQQLSSIQIQNAGAPVTYYDQVSELITSIVAPASWDEVGGPASLRVFDGNLIIAQEWQTHEQIRALLETLREVRDGQVKSPPERAPVAAQTADERAARARIAKALSAVTPKLDFKEAKLSDVVAHLQDIADIPILLDHPALDEVGIDRDAPVSIAVKQISLRSALKLLLKSIDPTLEAIIRDEALVITTRECAEENLQTVFYPVADLTTPAAGKRARRGSNLFDELIETCTAIIEPDSWDEVGGPGSIADFEPAGCLIVSQTAYIHPPIADLLARLRAIRQQRKAGNGEQQNEVGDAQEEPYTLVIYRLRPGHGTGVDPQAPNLGGGGGVGGAGSANGEIGAAGAKATATLPALIQQVIQPESWRHREATIHLLGDNLIVKQKRSVHREISGLIIALELRGVGVGGFF